MNFSSLTEYFYKLYNICLALMIVPVACFLYLYQSAATNQLAPALFNGATANMILFVFGGFEILFLTIVHWLMRLKLRALAKEESLGVRLEKYVQVAALRFGFTVALCLAVSLGFYITHHPYFAICFVTIILWSVWIWPTPNRVCQDFKLRGDEKKMVLSKGDAFN
jgi:hypothetical protein